MDWFLYDNGLRLEKVKTLTDSLQRYWWLENSTIWLNEIILAYKLQIKICPDTEFLQKVTAPLELLFCTNVCQI